MELYSTIMRALFAAAAARLKSPRLSANIVEKTDSSVGKALMPTDLDPGMPDRAAIDAEYDPSLRVASRQPYLDWYLRESAQAREKLDCSLDIPFGPSAAETLDIFPSQTSNSPVVMFIHGGYWRAFSSKEFSFFASGLVPHGITVAVMNYALCPQVTIAEITRQSQAAVAWLAGNAQRYGGNPAEIFVAGHSAGGQQVGMLMSGAGSRGLGGASQEAEDAARLIKGGIGISGLFDLRPLQHSWVQPSLQLTDSLAAEQSPLLQIPRHAAPLLLTVGGDESASFLSQSQNYLAAWRKAGLDGEYFPQPGRNHYESVYGFADPASALSRAAAAFIRPGKT
jgi:arylformamidase